MCKTEFCSIFIGYCGFNAGILTDFEYNSTDFCRIIQFLPDIGAIWSVLTIP